MREMNEIREAIENINVATARGRRELNNRELKVTPSGRSVSYDASARADGYIEVAQYLREKVESNFTGIPSRELEDVEFIMEQLEALAKQAYEQVIRTY